jgi:hypothetical protein
MLLNEFLKEHRKNEKQEATIARLEKQVEALSAGPTKSERTARTEQVRTPNRCEQSVTPATNAITAL